MENAYKKIHANVQKDFMVYGVNIVRFYNLNKVYIVMQELQFLAKCIIPCSNGGKCKGVNKCRCVYGFKGDHCEIGQPMPQHFNCKRPCRQGYCTANATCRCEQGWSGKFCQRSNLL